MSLIKAVINYLKKIRESPCSIVDVFNPLRCLDHYNRFVKIIEFNYKYLISYEKRFWAEMACAKNKNKL